ncbi:hypothetical protein OOK41_02310 [Micromonospora sp. NBC_01655]|uniref:hypothetical protein n=1 Tax=Micromonospora sp. NBC_01655 TaxID=2975983 RepID=UPI00224FD53D|nr:hypothetical protein [Micromonospora sp. NBC_01655]MCX4469158.1 hypothetical protein [Micromonospora sp. NBC_01655]
MTPHNTTPSPAGGQHQRHRLVARARLAAGYESRYGSAAVSAYGLAVRDVVEGCPEIGPIDTWSKLSERICRDRPGRNRDALRKRLSRHFTTETKGPPWPTVVLVVEYTVPRADRDATLDRLGRLYEAAREERPPSRGREPAGPVHPHAGAHPNDGDGSGGNGGGGGEDGLRRENASLRRRLAASQAENDLLRAALRAPARPAVRGHSRHRPLGGEPRPEDVPRQRESSAPGGTPRGGWNPGRFPAGPAPTNEAPAGRHRSPRVDPVWLTVGPAPTPLP